MREAFKEWLKKKDLGHVPNVKPNLDPSAIPRFLENLGFLSQFTGLNYAPGVDLNDPTNKDSVPAVLTPGEFVLNKEASQMFRPQIEAMNEAGLQQRHMENEMVKKNMGGPLSEVRGYQDGTDTYGGGTREEWEQYINDPGINFEDKMWILNNLQRGDTPNWYNELARSLVYKDPQLEKQLAATPNGQFLLKVVEQTHFDPQAQHDRLSTFEEQARAGILRQVEKEQAFDEIPQWTGPSALPAAPGASYPVEPTVPTDIFVPPPSGRSIPPNPAAGARGAEGFGERKAHEGELEYQAAMEAQRNADILADEARRQAGQGGANPTLVPWVKGASGLPQAPGPSESPIPRPGGNVPPRPGFDDRNMTVPQATGYTGKLSQNPTVGYDKFGRGYDEHGNPTLDFKDVSSWYEEIKRPGHFKQDQGGQ